MSGLQILLVAWFGFTLIAIFFLIILSYFNDRRVNREWSDHDHIQMHKDMGDFDGESFDGMSFDGMWTNTEEEE